MTDDRDHRLRRVETLVLVAIGGVVRANARYVLGFVSSGPSGTFVANATGSLVL